MDQPRAWKRVDELNAVVTELSDALLTYIVDTDDLIAQLQATVDDLRVRVEALEEQ